MTSHQHDTKQVRDLNPLIAFLATLVAPLSRAFGSNCEVVLHDLSNLDNSVVAIAGEFTGRSVGSRPMGLLLSRLQAGNYDDVIGYDNVLTDGRLCKSSTIFIWPTAVQPNTDFDSTSISNTDYYSDAISKMSPLSVGPAELQLHGDSDGPTRTQSHPNYVRSPEDMRPMAALCINIDLNVYEQVVKATNRLAMQLNWMTAGSQTDAQTEEHTQTTLDSFVLKLVEDAINDIGVPVDLMKKHHKVAVVARLLKGGMFQVREGVDIVASALQVSRFTIYNYLNSLDDVDNEDQ